MYSLLLALIYLAFISLGLPDSLLGSAWPSMYPELCVPVSYGGVVSMIIACGTVISSLNTNRVVTRFGTGLVTTISVLMTAIALFGFSFSRSFWMLCLWAIPYGLGAGAVDAALNNFVALNYASRHMNWLHCFWGFGASIGPYIMSYSLAVKNSWENGYVTVALIQITLTAVLFFSLPIWRKQEQTRKADQTGTSRHLSVAEALKIKGVKETIMSFVAYSGVETTTGLWASSYLVLHRGIDVEAAARWASLFFLGITIGRFLSGFVSDRLGDRNVIRIGMAVITVGLMAVVLPIQINVVPLVGLLMIGLGCAPIYPSIIHQTPANFGEENSQAIIGIQVASAYVGSTFMPPIFGLLTSLTTIAIFPAYLGLFLVLMLAVTERLNRLAAYPVCSQPLRELTDSYTPGK